VLSQRALLLLGALLAALLWIQRPWLQLLLLLVVLQAALQQQCNLFLPQRMVLHLLV
jgi:hypothetical protein